MASGVASRPIADMDAYREQLTRFVFRSGLVMKPVFEKAKAAPKRVVYAEGEDERVLRAAQVVIEEGLARAALIGRPQVIEARLARFGLSIRPGRDFEIVDPSSDPRYKDYWTLYHEIAGRRGITPDAARTFVRTNPTVIAALAVRRGDADAMICGLEGGFLRHLRVVRDIIGLAPGVRDFSTLTLILTAKGAHFIADTQVTPDPTAEDIAEMAVLSAAHVRRFGMEPRIALVSHSDFGSYDSASSRKMRAALACLVERHPELEVDGEMHIDTALVPTARETKLGHSRLSGEANVLILPNLDAANIAVQLARSLADALPVGPILIGAASPAHILTRSVTSRGVVNMTAVAAVEAQKGMAGP
jgi:malate dehydrogenase (oxaloacetate-decarboxylating)(NADP+)